MVAGIGLATEIPCPQCGVLVVPPHQVDTFPCPSCGSTLRPAAGLRVYRLRQPVRVSREAAAQAVLGWFALPDLPRNVAAAPGLEVGPLTSFPFLRLRTFDSDRVVPLAPLPAPEVADLGRAPAELVPEGEGSWPEAAAGSADDMSRRIAASDEILREEIRLAVGDPAVRELALEERVYYPVRYKYGGETFVALVEAGAGRVLALRHPGRSQVVGEWGLALGAGVVLFGEALLIPSLPLKLGAVVVTAIALHPFYRWLVATRG